MHHDKNKNTRAQSGFGHSLRALAGILLIPLSVFVFGCSDLLEVELPTKVDAGVLNDPGLAPMLVNSALGDFECAFTNYVPATGLLAGEVRHSTGWFAYTFWDHRRVFPESDTSPCDVTIGYGVYRPMQTARFQAKQARELLDEFPDDQVPDKQSLRATVLAYEGYALTMLGEGWCEMAIDQSAIMQPGEVLALAEARFLDAIADAQGSGNSDILNTARVGLARTLLNLGNASEAVQVAEQVPEGFVRHVTRGTADKRRWNLLHHDNHSERYISVDPSYADLTWQGAPDSRVEVVPGGTGHDGTDILSQLKFTDVSAPIPLASWTEAQLIIAEAEGGQVAVDIINTLHSRAGLPPFESSDPDEILDHVLQERARELYLQGHRLNDMLRHDLPFKTGTAPHDGVSYGETTCMPLPQVEIDGNPNIP